MLQQKSVHEEKQQHPLAWLSSQSFDLLPMWGTFSHCLFTLKSFWISQNPATHILQHPSYSSFLSQDVFILSPLQSSTTKIGTSHFSPYFYIYNPPYSGFTPASHTGSRVRHTQHNIWPTNPRSIMYLQLTDQVKNGKAAEKGRS